MKSIEYAHFREVNSDEFIPLLNKKKIREHLINHELFDAESIELWANGKIKLDACKGCKVRAILVNKKLAGWCGIQLEDGKYEVAIILDDSHWGLGVNVFREVMVWAKKLDHDTVFIHFLDSRPEYKFLRKIAKNVYVSEILGSRFTTYELSV